MSRLKRPYIPLAVRVIVAERQFDAATPFPPWNGEQNASVFRTFVDRDGWKKRNPLSEQLDMLLRLLFGEQKVNLDHDPPLGARKKIFRKRVHVDYDPPANDPTCLVYRLAVDHRTKTNVRGEHGQHPDRVLIKKNRRLEELQSGKAPRRRKAKIPNKKNFKWPSRPFNRNRPGGKPGIQTTKETNT